MVVIAALLLASFPVPTAAMEVDRTPPDLPEAREVLDRYAEAIGGEEAWERHRSMTLRGTVELPDVGMGATFVSFVISPDARMDVIEFPGFGTTRTGYNDGIGWSLDPMSGPRLLEGDELASQAEAADLMADLRRPAYVRDAVVLERTEVAGQSCYLLRVVRRSGREAQECYHVDTGLRVMSRSVRHEVAGEVEMTTYFVDWQAVDRVVLPRTIRYDRPDGTLVMVFEDVDTGPVDPAEVALPAEVRALLD